MRTFFILLPLALGMCGCGAGDFGQVPASAVVFATPPAGTPFTGSFYHAYGDSITYGSGSLTPATQAYPALVAEDKSITLANRGIGGRMACDLPVEEIFPAQEAPALNGGGLYSVLVGTNDIGFRGAGPYEAVFNLCERAAIGWLALPEEFKLRATAPAVVTAGATSLDPTAGFNAVVTNAVGASITFPLKLAAPAPVYVWYRIVDGNPGSFHITLDGAVVASPTTATSPNLLTFYAQSSTSLALLRLPPVSAGSHSLAVVQTSTGAYGAGVVAIGVPPPAGTTGLPRVLVGTVPPSLVASSGACSTMPAACRAYTADIAGNTALFAQDHLDVLLFNPGKYMSATSADMADSTHPNALGYREIRQAFEEVSR